jgi:membrane protein implicated in regulation of membrane protease activity
VRSRLKLRLLLLLLGLLLLTKKVVGLLHTVRVVGLECGLLWLDCGLLREEGLYAKLIETGRLRREAICIAIRISCLLRLSILVVEEAGALRLLLKRVSKPIDSWLLLVALIVACRLGLGRCRSIVEERCGVLFFELAGSGSFLFFAESDGLCEIIVSIGSLSVLGAAALLFLCFMLASFDGQTHLGILFILSGVSSFTLRTVRRARDTRRGKLIKTSHSVLPQLAICSLAAETFFIEHEGREFLRGETN